MLQGEERIGVLIVDDHPAFAHGLAALVDQQSDMKSVGVACNGETALKLVEELKPDIVVMDISMPGMNGIEATRAIKEKHPEIPVLVLSAYGYQPYLVSAVSAGAGGYLLKNVPLKQLLNAIRSVHSGETVLEQSLATKLFRSVAEPSRAASDGRLDEKDKGLLRLGALGLSNKEIGERLFLSERSVQARFSALFDKLGVASRMEGILRAIKEGWLNVDDLP